MQPFKCPIINGKNGNAIYCDGSKGASFGEGKDLDIGNGTYDYDYGSFRWRCSSILGATYQYQPPNRYHQYNTPQTKTLFVGTQGFTPTEVEVFY